MIGDVVRDRPLSARPLVPVSALLAAGALAVPLASMLSRHPPRVQLVAASGLALVLVPALALLRYEAAVMLGFALLGVAMTNPAACDLVFVVVLAVGAVTGRFAVRNVAVLPVGLVLVLLILNLLSAVEVVDATRAAVFFGTTLYLALFGLWLAAWTTSPRRSRIVTGGYVFAAASSALLGFAALVGPLPGRDLMLDGGRVKALFQDPNVLGPFLIPAALILLEDTLTPRLFRLNRLVKAGLVVLLSLVSVLSYSRGAWVNLAVGIAVMLVVLALRRRGGRKALAVLLSGAVLAVIAGAGLSASGQTRFLEERAHLQSYDAERFGAQRVGVRMSERYPLGVGPGQFERIEPISTHSTYVRVLAEQGLPGLVVFVGFVTATLGAATANALAGRGTYGIGSAALLAAWVGILANSVVIDTLHWRHLWLVAALIWAGRQRGRLSGRGRRPSPRT
jgi:O-antigen ligase